MSPVFGRDYADVYDALYRGKDYSGEVDLIERVLEQHGAARPCRVLDIGCGTGRHAFELARHGYAVAGIDNSPFMLAHARQAAIELGTKHPVPRFAEGDARSFDLGERFDAALMMFAVLGYQQADEDVSAALDTVRCHLEPGGLFVFDVWNGLAVLAQGPGSRTASVTDGPVQIVRTSATKVDAERRLCHVHFDIRRTDPGEASRTWSEEHTMRYFFPNELSATLERSGFQLLDLSGFPDSETPPDERAWNVIGVAKAR